MIKIFGQTDKVYTSNGDVVLRPLKARVTKKDNGDYFLDLECGLEYVDYLVEGNIITANTPTGDQAFRIGNVTKSKYKLVSKCYHVYYDSYNYLIADSLVENRTCDYAIKHLNQATEPTSEFTVSSDITRLNSFRCVRKSLYEAIDTILEKWGGHLVRDNFDIQIKNQIGQDNGIIVQYKKNLKDISVQENWSNVVTKLLPVGKDGLLLNKLNPSASIYLVSDIQYVLPYTKTVSFSQEGFDPKDYPTESAYFQALIDDLREQGTKYLEQNCVPKVSYTLKANLDRVTDIGDTIEVIDERLSINMMTNVTGFVYDCIFEKYTEVEFGTFTNSINNLMSNINRSVNKAVDISMQTMSSEMTKQIAGISADISEVETSVEAVQQQANNISAILNDSYVTYNGTAIKVFESLPSAEAEKILRLSYNGLEMSGDGGETWDVLISIRGLLNLDNLSAEGDLDFDKLTLSGSVDLDTISLSGAVDIDTITINKSEDEITDFVLSEGDSGDWFWRKYTSGRVEAWCQLSIDSDDLSWTAFNTLYTADIDITFPFDIFSAIITATMDDCPDIGWIASVSTTDETAGSATVVREGDQGNFSVNIIVRGDL